MRAQFAKTMLEVGRSDPKLAVLVGDIGAFGLREFATECPERFYNFGIREQALASAAAGLAMTGFKPVIHSIVPFIVERCFEQIKIGFGYQKQIGNIVSVGSGFDYSRLGCTHHSYSDIALIKSLPGSQVFYPGSKKEFDLLFKQNYARPGVNYFRLAGEAHQLDLGTDSFMQAVQISPIYSDPQATLVCSAGLLREFIQAAQDLESQYKIKAQILYYPTIKPFDAETVIKSVQKSGRVLVAEDHSIYGGLGEEVLRAIAGIGLKSKPITLGVKDDFVRDYGSRAELLGSTGMGVKEIVQNVKGWF